MPTWWWRAFPTRQPFTRTISATWPWTCSAPSTTSKTPPLEITSRSESVSSATVSRDKVILPWRVSGHQEVTAQSQPPIAASELAGIHVLIRALQTFPGWPFYPLNHLHHLLSDNLGMDLWGRTQRFYLDQITQVHMSRHCSLVFARVRCNLAIVNP